ncbi:PapD-like protein [Obelidium mucronatum]|nr:PapD-like protein [Obelidium mucronatum]
MSLSVAEDGLEFRRPFNQVVKQYIHLKNSADAGIIAFKIKTTAPKHYCVRPNAGIIAAGDSREVEVLLQPDVLAAEAEAQTARLAELWANAEDAKKSGHDGIVLEKKLKCAFLPPLGLDVPSVPLPGNSAAAAKPSPATPDFAAAPAPAASERELKDAKDAIKRLTVACEGYKSEIERLNQLRQRRAMEEKSGGGAVSGGDGNAQLQTQNGQGLSLPLAIVLAIIAFILGAFLF